MIRDNKGQNCAYSDWFDQEENAAVKMLATWDPLGCFVMCNLKL